MKTITVVSVTLAALAADAANDYEENDEQKDCQNDQHPPIVRECRTGGHWSN